MSALDSLPIYVAAIIAVAVLGGTGALMLSQMKETAYTVTSHAIVNETSSVLGAIPVTLTTANTRVTASSQSLVLINSTNNNYLGTLTLNTNYSVLSYSLGTFNITDISGRNASNVKINSTYTYTTQDSNAATGIIDNGSTAITTFTNQLNLIATVIGFGIVLLVVFRILPQFSGGGSGE